MFQTAVRAQGFGITSFGSNGRLTWTNTCTNGIYSVQWASALTTNTQWMETWDHLKYLRASSNSTTVDVPMFYRVRCITNLFWPMPLGCTVTQTVSDRFGANRGTQVTMVLGVLTIPSATNDYIMALVTGPEGTSILFFRSTDRAVYMVEDSKCPQEELGWTNGPVGTSWTIYECNGEIRVRTLVSTNETLAVPAGVFTGCLCFSNRCVNCSGVPWPYYFEYVKPGFGMVQWVDYWVEDTNAAPFYYKLQSITYQ
jgi:hypothetical protein